MLIQICYFADLGKIRDKLMNVDNVNSLGPYVDRVVFRFKGSVKARITSYKSLYEVGGTFKIYKCVIMHPHCRGGRVNPFAPVPFPPQSLLPVLMLYLIFSKAPSLIMRKLRL